MSATKKLELANHKSGTALEIYARPIFEGFKLIDVSQIIYTCTSHSILGKGYHFLFCLMCIVIEICIGR